MYPFTISWHHHSNASLPVFFCIANESRTGRSSATKLNRGSQTRKFSSARSSFASPLPRSLCISISQAVPSPTDVQIPRSERSNQDGCPTCAVCGAAVARAGEVGQRGDSAEGRRAQYLQCTPADLLPASHISLLIPSSDLCLISYIRILSLQDTPGILVFDSGSALQQLKTLLRLRFLHWRIRIVHTCILLCPRLCA